MLVSAGLSASLRVCLLRAFFLGPCLCPCLRVVLLAEGGLVPACLARVLLALPRALRRLLSPRLGVSCSVTLPREKKTKAKKK